MPFHTAHSYYGADYNRSSACQVLQSSEKRNPECLDGPVNFSVLAGQWNCFWFWAGRDLALIHGVDKAATKSIYNNIQYTIVTNYTGIKTFKVNIKAWLTKYDTKLTYDKYMHIPFRHGLLNTRPKLSIRGHKGQNFTGTRCRGFLVLKSRCRGFLNLGISMSWLFVLWKNALESRCRGLFV